jgi:hypothetical protein
VTIAEPEPDTIRRGLHPSRERTSGPRSVTRTMKEWVKLPRGVVIDCLESTRAIPYLIIRRSLSISTVFSIGRASTVCPLPVIVVALTSSCTLLPPSLRSRSETAVTSRRWSSLPRSASALCHWYGSAPAAPSRMRSRSLRCRLRPNSRCARRPATPSPLAASRYLSVIYKIHQVGVSMTMQRRSVLLGLDSVVGDFGDIRASRAATFRTNSTAHVQHNCDGWLDL